MGHHGARIPSRKSPRVPLRLVLASLAVLGGLAAATWALSSWLFLRGFDRVEEDLARQGVDRARRAVALQVRQLGSVARDWSAWDDAWQFLGGERPAFPALNATGPVLSNLRVDLMAWCDPRGLLVDGRRRDARHDESLPPDDRERSWAEGLCREAAAGSGHAAGLHDGPRGPGLHALRPVVQSSGEGPSRGYLLLVRDLPTVLHEIRPALQLDLALVPPSDPSLPAEARPLAVPGPGGDATAIERASDDLLVAYTALRDRDGQAVGLLASRSARTVTRLGHDALDAFLWALGILATLAALALFLLARNLLMARESRREARRLYQAVVERTSEGILLLRGDRLRVLDANPAAEGMLGRPVRDLRGMPMLSLVDVHPDRYGSALGVLRAHGQASLGEARVRRPDGSLVAVEATANAVSSEAGETVCLVLHDLTDRVRAEEAVRHHAFHDSLTGLPNRVLFADRLSMALARARRTGEALAVLYLDLDDFKSVNDGLGHDAGDLLLKQAAGRIQAAVREGDTVARQGGDEFLVLLPSVGTAETALGVAERIADRFRQPFEVLGQEFAVTTSLGIALFPGDGGSGDELVRNADIAMYHAKERGRNHVEMFDGSMRDRASAAVRLKQRLSFALERGEFELHYQPILSLADGRVRSLEALLRWRDPEQGLVAPARFLRAVEESGLILPVGEWVLRQACADARAWAGAGFDTVGVSVNLSSQQFRRRGLEALVEAVLSDTGLPPRLLDLEITESAAMNDPEIARKILESLRSLGARVALDDFGVGHSSLGQLRTLPLDAVKIDRSFVADLPRREEDRAIVAGIVGLSHTLGLQVVAEGVETRKQLILLRECGADAVQGFGLCRPVPFADLVPVLQRADALLRTLEEPPRTPPAEA